jgi:Cu+-exporting ATPase
MGIYRAPNLIHKEKKMSKKLISLIAVSVLSASLPALACELTDKQVNRESSFKTNLMAGQKTAHSMVKMGKVFNVKGMFCKSCVEKVTKAISQVKGVKSVKVDLKSNTAKVVLLPNADEKAVDPAIEQAVKKSGYKASLMVIKS